MNAREKNSFATTAPKERVELKTRRLWTRYVAGLVGVCSILAFLLVSITVHGQPDTSPFQGWIAVLQESDGTVTSHHQLLLRVEAIEPGAPGDHPELAYTAVVCGDRPFRGVLVIGGDAQLNDADAFASADPDLEVEYVPSLKLGYPGNAVAVGSAQVVELNVESPTLCVPGMPEAMSGIPVIVTGRSSAPIHRTWSLFDLWEGPRSNQAWPLVGGVPGLPPKSSGVFDATEGLPGSWQLVLQRRNLIYGGGLTGRATVETVRPEPVSTTRLTWESPDALQPIALVTDNEAMAAWQTGLVVAAISFGIGGSLLASLLLEWARPISAPNRVALQESLTRVNAKHTASATEVDTTVLRQRAHTRRQTGHHPILIGLGILFVAAAAVARSFGRRRSKQAERARNDGRRRAEG